MYDVAYFGLQITNDVIYHSQREGSQTSAIGNEDVCRRVKDGGVDGSSTRNSCWYYSSPTASEKVGV